MLVDLETMWSPGEQSASFLIIVLSIFGLVGVVFFVVEEVGISSRSLSDHAALSITASIGVGLLFVLGGSILFQLPNSGKMGDIADNLESYYDVEIYQQEDANTNRYEELRSNDVFSTAHNSDVLHQVVVIDEQDNIHRDVYIVSIPGEDNENTSILKLVTLTDENDLDKKNENIEVAEWNNEDNVFSVNTDSLDIVID